MPPCDVRMLACRLPSVCPHVPKSRGEAFGAARSGVGNVVLVVREDFPSRSWKFTQAALDRPEFRTRDCLFPPIQPTHEEPEHPDAYLAPRGGHKGLSQRKRLRRQRLRSSRREGDPTASAFYPFVAVRGGSVVVGRLVVEEGLDDRAAEGCSAFARVAAMLPSRAVGEEYAHVLNTENELSESPERECRLVLEVVGPAPRQAAS